ncbi:MAG: MEDS domain-containing protein [Acidimicrobiales bacterium]
MTRATGSAGFGDHRVRSRRPRASTGFRHEAIFYSGDAAFVSATSPFLRQGIEANEPALVVVSGSKIDALRDELGDEAGSVQFADMEDVGLNPVRIIALWQRFVERHAPPGHPVRGIGEPLWSERSPAEMAECQRHERLLNLAFTNTRDFWLLCPYDSESLDESVIEEARHGHSYLSEGGSGSCASDRR